MKKSIVLRLASMAMATAMAFTAMPNMQLKAEAASLQQKYELLDNVQDSAILHCWNWSYKTIEQNMELIAESGYSAIQTSPCTQPKDYTYKGVVGTEVGYPGEGGSGNWWKLYQPVTFSVCDNGETWLGSKAELESMCATAEKYGIKVIVDVVANHMGNITGWKNSLSDVSPQVGEYWNPDMLTDESYWHINDLQVWMSDGREHFTQGSMGMPDLNTQDKRVQKYVADYLDELIDCGVDGFRFDAAKHIETPQDDSAFAGDFWPTVLGEARSHYKSTVGGELYVYGEILNTVGDNFSIDNYTQYMSVTDNSAGNHLLEAFRNNNIGILGMDYAAEKSVLWAESHDTFMNESSRYASDKSIVRTWAMVENKDNAAALFFVRPYESSEFLNNDQDGSFKSNIKNTVEPAQMGACETYVWASDEVAAINHFNNRMSKYSESYGSDGNVAYCKRGDGIVLASFNGAGDISMSAHGLADGTYTDEVSRNTFTVSGGRLSGTITSEYGIAVIYKNVMANPTHDYPVQIGCDKGDGTVFYSDSLTATVTAKYATEASYVASTGETGSFTDSATITIGKNLKAGEQVTLTVTASNKNGSDSKTFTYTKDEYDLSSCIFFKNTKGWSDVTAYLWNDKGTKTVKNASWPGEKMFECDSENHIFALKVDQTAEYNKIIFSNNGASQTKDLAIGEIGYMYDMSTGKWSEYKSEGPVVKTPTITATVDSKEFTKSLTVTYKVSDAQSATITVNGVKESFTGSVTKTFTKNTTVEINAVNETKTANKKYTYTRKLVLPTVSVSPSTATTYKDTVDVTVSAANADEAYYTVDGVKTAFTGSKTITIGDGVEAGASVVVTVGASNEDGVATPVSVTLTKALPVSTTKIYLKVSACGWFKNDNAVPAIKTNVDSEYTRMTAEVDKDGNEVYTAEISTDATRAKVVRMLPSGRYYNEVSFDVNNGNDYFTGNNSWSGVTGTKYNSSQPTQDMITVYFVNNYNWSNVKAYTWGGSVKSASWPGDSMTYVGTNEAGQGIYKYEMAANSKGLIFTNGNGVQTNDITSGFVNGVTYKLTGSGNRLNVEKF